MKSPCRAVAENTRLAATVKHYDSAESHPRCETTGRSSHSQSTGNGRHSDKALPAATTVQCTTVNHCASELQRIHCEVSLCRRRDHCDVTVRPGANATTVQNCAGHSPALCKRRHSEALCTRYHSGKPGQPQMALCKRRLNKDTVECRHSTNTEVCGHRTNTWESSAAVKPVKRSYS